MPQKNPFDDRRSLFRPTRRIAGGDGAPPLQQFTAAALQHEQPRRDASGFEVDGNGSDDDDDDDDDVRPTHLFSAPVPLQQPQRQEQRDEATIRKRVTISDRVTVVPPDRAAVQRFLLQSGTFDPSNGNDAAFEDDDDDDSTDGDDDEMRRAQLHQRRRGNGTHDDADDDVEDPDDGDGDDDDDENSLRAAVRRSLALSQCVTASQEQRIKDATHHGSARFVVERPRVVRPAQAPLAASRSKTLASATPPLSASHSSCNTQSTASAVAATASASASTTTSVTAVLPGLHAATTTTTDACLIVESQSSAVQPISNSNSGNVSNSGMLLLHDELPLFVDSDPSQQSQATPATNTLSSNCASQQQQQQHQHHLQLFGHNGGGVLTQNAVLARSKPSAAAAAAAAAAANDSTDTTEDESGADDDNGDRRASNALQRPHRVVVGAASSQASTEASTADTSLATTQSEASLSLGVDGSSGALLVRPTLVACGGERIELDKSSTLARVKRRQKQQLLQAARNNTHNISGATSAASRRNAMPSALPSFADDDDDAVLAKNGGGGDASSLVVEKPVEGWSASQFERSAKHNASQLPDEEETARATGDLESRTRAAGAASLQESHVRECDDRGEDDGDGQMFLLSEQQQSETQRQGADAERMLFTPPVAVPRRCEQVQTQRIVPVAGARIRTRDANVEVASPPPPPPRPTAAPLSAQQQREACRKQRVCAFCKTGDGFSGLLARLLADESTTRLLAAAGRPTTATSFEEEPSKFALARELFSGASAAGESMVRAQSTVVELVDDSGRPISCHMFCAQWCPEVFTDRVLKSSNSSGSSGNEADAPKSHAGGAAALTTVWHNVVEAHDRAEPILCTVCRRGGAPTGCLTETCQRSFHAPCAHFAAILAQAARCNNEQQQQQPQPHANGRSGDAVSPSSTVHAMLVNKFSVDVRHGDFALQCGSCATRQRSRRNSVTPAKQGGGAASPVAKR